VSTPAEAVGDEPYSASDAVAGFLAAASIFVAALTVMNISFTIQGVEIAFRPVKTGFAAEIVALVAVGMSSGRSRLPEAAALSCAFGWFAAMVVAIVVNRPLF
jgi:hypothetical protein